MHSTKPLITLLAAMAALSPALAAPTTVPFHASANHLTKRCVSGNTQSCSVTDNVFFLSYSIDIGITFADGSGCDYVLGAIQGQGVAVTNWQCVDDGCGNTQLWFNTPNGVSTGDGINAALVGVYPTVEGGFYCPDE